MVFTETRENKLENYPKAFPRNCVLRKLGHLVNWHSEGVDASLSRVEGLVDLHSLSWWYCTTLPVPSEFVLLLITLQTAEQGFSISRNLRIPE